MANTSIIVEGIDTFVETFSPFKDFFVIIGGAACRAILSEGRFLPRKTKDIDMVLVLDRLDADFVKTFWTFIKAGEYKCALRKDDEGKIKYVRYSFNSEQDGYPAQIELLSHPTSELGSPEEYHIEVIKPDDDSSCLSAIILEPDYYNYLISHTETKGGLRFASVDSLICLKVLAYLNLREEKKKGGHVNDDDLKKHRRDVIMAIANLQVGDEFIVSETIKAAIQKFIEDINTDENAKQSIIASLKLPDENLLNTYLETLADSFIIQ